MQLGVNKALSSEPGFSRHLGDLQPNEEATLEAIDLEPELAGRLMELGFLPGVTVSQGCCAPSGDPRVFRVDGSEVALRRETYERIAIRPRYSAAFA